MGDMVGLKFKSSISVLGNSGCCYSNLRKSQPRVKLFDFTGNSQQEPKHLYTNVDGWCNGVANMMFRVASLYGIGKQLNRIPCLEGKCAEEYQKELYYTFPQLVDFPMRVRF
jgi:hypothetical protein